MIVVTNIIKIKKGHVEEVAARFGRSNGVEGQPGFVRMEVLHTQGLEDYDELKVCTTWADKASFESWVKSDNFKQAHLQRAAERESAEKNGSGTIVLGSKMTTHSVLLSRTAEGK